MTKSISGVRKGVLALLATAALSACGAEPAQEAAPAAPPAQPETPPAVTAPDVAAPDMATPDAAGDDEAMRSAAGHVHGEAAMTVSLEGSTLSISLVSPLYNIVGFEREPENDAEKAALDASFAYFGDAALVFTLPAGAGCEATESSVMANITAHGADETAGTGDTHEHAHDDGAAEDEHSDHEAHEDHDAHDHTAAAGEIEVDYVFECAAPDRLDYVDTTLMDNFQRLERLDVVSFRDDLQAAQTLERGQSRVELPR